MLGFFISGCMLSIDKDGMKVGFMNKGKVLLQWENGFPSQIISSNIPLA